MHRTTTIAALTLLAALTLAGCGKSDAEIQDDCYQAIGERAAGDKSKPKACEALSDDDYQTLLLGWVLKQEGLDEVDEHPEDLLDYGEDGVVDRKQ